MQLHPATLEFLKVIREENSRAYFASIRPLYEDIRANLLDFIGTLTKEFAKIDPDFNNIDPKQCIFRIYRDARRLKPWDPLYKYHRWMVIAPEGTRSRLARPYIQLSPWRSFVGWGIWRRTSKELLPIREYISQYGEEYYNITQNKQFKNYFWHVSWQVLQWTPRWFSTNTPYLELVKHRQFVIKKSYTDKEILGEHFLEEVIKNFTIAQDFYTFLNQSLEE